MGTAGHATSLLQNHQWKSIFLDPKHLRMFAKQHTIVKIFEDGSSTRLNNKKRKPPNQTDLIIKLYIKLYSLKSMFQ